RGFHKQIAHTENRLPKICYLKTGIGMQKAIPDIPFQIVLKVLAAFPAGNLKIMCKADLPAQQPDKLWMTALIQRIMHIRDFLSPQSLRCIIQAPPKLIATCPKLLLCRLFHIIESITWQMPLIK